ncbi:MAG: hypothetical protein ISR57_02815 [Bacteroidales bacterium]|nr:hypothetical protein [Bacteroidota bacterium]MBL6949553.1 hypothetical protein [Bacteroidales bacterium]
MTLLEHTEVKNVISRIRSKADFELLFTTHYSKLCSYANGFIKDLDASEEIVQLPLERRKIFIMSRYDGLTYNQIAGELNISVKTVENQMGKALKFLRDELADYLPWFLLIFYVFKN